MWKNPQKVGNFPGWDPSSCGDLALGPQRIGAETGLGAPYSGFPVLGANLARVGLIQAVYGAVPLLSRWRCL
jgi:hypothetical protein